MNPYKKLFKSKASKTKSVFGNGTMLRSKLKADDHPKINAKKGDI